MARWAGLLGALPAQPLRPNQALALPPAWLCTDPKGVMEGEGHKEMTTTVGGGDHDMGRIATTCAAQGLFGHVPASSSWKEVLR